jgi:preprotein translocase subunit SecF
MAFTFPKPIELIPQGTKFPFVSYFKLFFTLSVALNLLTIILLATLGLNFGIDFRGGTVVEIRTQQPADIAALRTTIGGLGLGEPQIQGFGTPNDVLIRLAEQPGGEKAQQDAVAKVRTALGPNVEFRRTEVVGGTVSGELLEKAVWALVLTALGIFIYVWFRFEWQFALGAVIALVHDVLLTVGVFSAFQLDFDLTVVAALLTILGYSINDTVVIYDRIRENLRKFKKMPLEQLLDLSVNETLSRTIMTVGTTFLALLALYLFGGEVIRGFTFAMLFGVIVGTYSSVFIAAPFLVLVGVKRDWSGVAVPTGKRGRAAAKAAEATTQTTES